MTAGQPQLSILDARLAEVDERLRTIQPAADLIAELRALAATQERLLASLRAFEQALSGLDGVRAVRVRGCEGGDRALLDVHLT